MKKHLQIGNWSHFSGEARQPNGDLRLITTKARILVEFAFRCPIPLKPIFKKYGGS